MTGELREALGKAAFEIWEREGKDSPGWEDMPKWEDMPDEGKVYFYDIAESVVRHLAILIGIPILHMLLSEDDVKSLLAQLSHE